MIAVIPPSFFHKLITFSTPIEWTLGTSIDCSTVLCRADIGGVDYLCNASYVTSTSRDNILHTRSILTLVLGELARYMIARIKGLLHGLNNSVMS